MKYIVTTAKHHEGFAMYPLARAALALFGLLGSVQTAHAQRITFDSIAGPITPREIDSFKQFMQTRSPGTTSWGGPGHHNAIADGAPGRDVEALGLMFEATGDVEILDRMIFFVDAFLTMRNDEASGRVIWTGRREPIWLPEAPDSPRAAYAASESADTVAHIAFAAKLISQQRALWRTQVPGGDPNGFGATYLQRARTYLQTCDQSMDEYFLKWFVESGTNLIREPTNNPLWAAVATNVIAINRQMMFQGAFQRLAEAHEALGDDPARVARYDAVARASVRECLDGMKNPYQVAGHTVYRWNYFPDGTHGIESTGHGNYDVLGVHRAFARARVYGITLDEVVPFADTVSYVIAKGDGTFSSNVDGSGAPQNYLAGEWLPVGQWNDSAYGIMATADIASRAATSPHIAASIFWMKQRRVGLLDGGAPAATARDAASDPGVPADARLAETPSDSAAPAPAGPDGGAVVPSPAGPGPAGGCGCTVGAARSVGIVDALIGTGLALLVLARRRSGRRPGRSSARRR